MPNQYICRSCEKPFSAKRKNATFCSKPCVGVAITTKVRRSCESCGKEFPARPDNIALGFARYCSKSCSNRVRAIPAETRFWALVDKTTTPDGCWLWLGARDRQGYGLFTPEVGRQVVASRFAYTLANGRIGNGQFICHHCDNPPCVRPNHLFSGRNADNMQDMVRKGRSTKGRNRPDHSLTVQGHNNPAAKLTVDLVRKIRQRYAAGETQTAIANDVGVSQNCISTIIRRAAWAHVE